MSKLPRIKQEIFGQKAGSRQITAFGTAKTETPVYTTDIVQIQNSNFLQGWLSALLPDKAPWEEDMNALFYAITSQLAYLFQEGIPEYDPNTEYSLNAFVKGVGTNVIYCSMVPENLGNPLSNPDYWTVYNAGGGLATYEIGLPQPTLSNNLLPNEIWLEGGKVLKNSYPNLTVIYKDIYAPSTATDTDTYLYLPDFRNRVIWGATSFGYQNATLPSVVIPNTGWSISGRNPGTVTKGTLVAGSGKGEIEETLESLSPTNSNKIVKLSGQFTPSGVKARVKTRYQ